ncbi:MAG TPA: hypothetical protein DFR83_29650, partial [Deltaproteobacteria bacterium]|nr:hypothetical protein [Deltaproteobacteria bacterium]
MNMTDSPKPSSWLQIMAKYTLWPMVLLISIVFVRMAILDGWSEAVVMGVLAMGCLSLCHGLEAVLPFEGRPRDRKEDRLDYLNVFMTELFAQGLFRGVIFLSGVVLGTALSRRPELGLWQAAGLDQLPWVVEFMLAMVLIDLPLYWQHRWMHTLRGLWSVHTVHHSSQRLAAISGIRNHLLSPLMTASVSLAFGALGPSVDLFVAVHAWIVVKGWLQHANIDLRTPGFDLLFPTPRLHRFHHSRDPAESARNFGILTTVWDHMPWHRFPFLGRFMAFQHATWFAPQGRLAPAGYGSDLADCGAEESALATWWRHTKHPVAVWRELPWVPRMVRSMGWPVGVVGAVLLAHRLVVVGLGPGLVAAVVAALGVAWAGALQWLHPMDSHGHASHPEQDGGWTLDLLHLGLSEGVGHAVAQAGLSLAGLWLAGMVTMDGGLVPWTLLGLDGLPLLVQLAMAMLLLDLGLYWQHRLFHEIPPLWETHQVHHAVRSYGPTRAARHHPLSPIVTTAVWMGFALLGAPVEVFAMAQAFAATNGAMQHCGADLRIGRLDAVFAGPSTHRWHHARDLHDRNFGPNLTVWDQVPWHRLPLVGSLLRIQHTTFFRGAEPGPARIGLEEPLVSSSESALVNWFHQVVNPFRPLVLGAIRWLSFPVLVGGVGMGAFVAIARSVPVPLVVLLALLGVVLVNVGLERVIPFRESWASDRAETQTDLVHLFLSGLAPHVIVAALISLGAGISGVGLASVVGNMGLWHRLGLTGLPVVAQVCLTVVLLDFCLYWHHRVMHEVPFLWPIHEVHHAPETMTGTRVLRNHPVGPLLTNLFVVVLGALGMEPTVFVAAQAISLTVGIL